MYPIFCIHSSVEGHLGSLQLLAIINKEAMNIVEHVSLLHVEASSGYMPRSGVAGLFLFLFFFFFSLSFIPSFIFVFVLRQDLTV
jgi:ABC-type multidrug transport system permease subunit